MKYSKYLMLAATTVLFASCLDTEPLGSTKTEDQKNEVYEQDPSKVMASVNGIFATFSKIYTITADHYDFGYPTIMLTLDSHGMDMPAEDMGYNWFSPSLAYSDLAYTSTSTGYIWNFTYMQIRSANDVLGKIDPATEDATLQYYLAQALAMRAFDYFMIAQIYQNNYASVDPKTALCVPLITDKNKEDVAVNGCPRATVEDTYNFILSDLDSAIVFFDECGVKRADKRYIDGVVARAIRAKVYLTMHNYAKALEDANYVIENSTSTPYTIEELKRPMFIAKEEDSWLWGINIDETDEGAVGLVNFPGHACSFARSYCQVGAWRRCNKKLYNSISDTDVRKGWWLNANKTSPNITTEETEYLAGMSAPAYTNVKFASYNYELQTTTNANDFPLIRIEEMYMIKAECEGYVSSPADGATALTNFIKQYRDPSYSFTASSFEDLQNEVWRQRRIEFWGEGLSWFDLKRLDKDVDRRGGGYATELVFNIPAFVNGEHNPVLLYRVPQSEEQYNPQITEETNNPIATRPDYVKDEN